jgi:tetratricopeptide (TPR) repeat protein
MKTNWSACLCLLAVAALPATASDPEPDRLKAIWSHAMARMELQNDYWFDDGDFPRCIQSLRMMNDVTPDEYETATSLGWLLESTEQWDDALAVYVRFGKQNPADPDAAFPEANFYFMKKAYAKVPPLLEPTIGAKPHPNSFRILAHSYERLGLLEEASRVWKSYLEYVPSDGAAKVNLARVEKKLKGEFKPPAPPAK